MESSINHTSRLPTCLCVKRETLTSVVLNSYIRKDVLPFTPPSRLLFWNVRIFTHILTQSTLGVFYPTHTLLNQWKSSPVCSGPHLSSFPLSTPRNGCRTKARFLCTCATVYADRFVMDFYKFYHIKFVDKCFKWLPQCKRFFSARVCAWEKDRESTGEHFHLCCCIHYKKLHAHSKQNARLALALSTLSPSHSLFHKLFVVCLWIFRDGEGCHRDRDAYSKEWMWLS